jgi:hypothetical protein
MSGPANAGTAAGKLNERCRQWLGIPNRGLAALVESPERETSVSLDKDLSRMSPVNTGQLPTLEATPEKEPFDGDSKRFRTGVKSMRLGFAYEYDPYWRSRSPRRSPATRTRGSLSSFPQAPEDPVPARRWPGRGQDHYDRSAHKAIEIRGLIRRTLIIAPATLCFQWKREIQDQFREDFEVLRSDILRANCGSNPWQDKDQVVTSMGLQNWLCQ